MTRTVKLTGWPPKAGKLKVPGARTFSLQEDAAAEIDQLLAWDKDQQSMLHGVLSPRQRWALHVAVGSLRMRRNRP